MNGRQRFAALGLLVGVLALGACATSSYGGGGSTPFIPENACLDNAVPGYPDFRYVGPADTLSNAHATDVSPGVRSTDGACAGSPVEYGTIVRAANQAAAITKCTTAGAGTLVNPPNLGVWGYTTAPPDAWACVESP